MQISEHLLFYPNRGLFCLSDGKENCIASTGGYVTPLFVAALSGQLADKYPLLLKGKEWQALPVKTTFVSYIEISNYVALSNNKTVQASLPQEQREVLDKLVRIYLQWVIDKEDALVRDNPARWLEPAFYPIGVYAESDDFDPYDRYDSLPIAGFARAALYFFIANTAKNIIKAAVLKDDLQIACKESIEKCISIFDDRDNIILQRGIFRELVDAYLLWRFQQTEAKLSHYISLTNDDLWQQIYNDETHAYELFEKNMDSLRLYGIRPLLDLQGDLIKRIQKDHPYISASGKAIVPNQLPKEGDIKGLLRWLEEEKKVGRNHLADHDGNVAQLCKDTIFLQRINWHTIKPDSLRKAINRKISKK
ncbi:MAG: hypothetical protein IJV61_05505 [Paludibacteraceae bacterium]|nr:hypothetical protein [Paludibacteraceae bacterium]